MGKFKSLKMISNQKTVKFMELMFAKENRRKESSKIPKPLMQNKIFRKRGAALLMRIIITFSIILRIRVSSIVQAFSPTHGCT